jgi:hypothetical protein
MDVATRQIVRERAALSGLRRTAYLMRRERCPLEQRCGITAAA